MSHFVHLCSLSCEEPHWTHANHQWIQSSFPNPSSIGNMAPTAPRNFTVIHVATGITAEPQASHGHAKSSQPSASPTAATKRSFLVLCALLYTSASLGYSLLANRSTPSVSDPQLWMVCLPYVVIMIRKLLNTIRSMEDSGVASVSDQDLESQDVDEEECAFGSDPSHDVIAVVGDVCVYVVVLLLLGYAMLPWQVRTGQVSL